MDHLDFGSEKVVSQNILNKNKNKSEPHALVCARDAAPVRQSAQRRRVSAPVCAASLQAQT